MILKKYYYSVDKDRHGYINLEGLKFLRKMNISTVDSMLMQPVVYDLEYLFPNETSHVEGTASLYRLQMLKDYNVKFKKPPHMPPRKKRLLAVTELINNKYHHNRYHSKKEQENEGK